MDGQHLPRNSLYLNKRIKRKFRKSSRFRCCSAPTGNANKFASGYCCTYPSIYKRRDINVENKRCCREYSYNKDIIITS